MTIEFVESTAMSKQDIFILQEIGQQGFYIDVGAGDAVYGSNTYILDRAGWDGICIEPNPVNIVTLIRDRRCYLESAVLASTVREVEFMMMGEQSEKEKKKRTFGYNGGSGLTEFWSVNHRKKIEKNLSGRAVNTVSTTLEIICDKYKDMLPSVIDFLDIDTEYGSYDILSTFPFHKYPFKFINIDVEWDMITDSDYLQTEKGTHFESLLSPHGYEKHRQFGEDTMFINTNYA